MNPQKSLIEIIRNQAEKFKKKIEWYTIYDKKNQ